MTYVLGSLSGYSLQCSMRNYGFARSPVHSRQSGMLICHFMDSPVYSRQGGILICHFMDSPVYSRQSGILIQRGPPRPRESSAEEISWTTMPLSRRMPLVT